MYVLIYVFICKILTWGNQNHSSSSKHACSFYLVKLIQPIPTHLTHSVVDLSSLGGISLGGKK